MMYERLMARDGAGRNAPANFVAAVWRHSGKDAAHRPGEFSMAFVRAANAQSRPVVWGGLPGKGQTAFFQKCSKAAIFSRGCRWVWNAAGRASSAG
jgi:hypothetical protein